MTEQYDPMARIDDQIRWYDCKSGSCQRMFKRLKLVGLAAAAVIPFAAGLRASPFLTGGLGALVVILEGVQHLGRYQDNWASYRSTCEALRHEKYLYMGGAGPYAHAKRARELLIERTESLISTEHVKWIAVQQEGERKDNAAEKAS